MLHYENLNDFKTHIIKSSISFLLNLIWPSRYMTKITGKRIEQQFLKESDSSRLINNYKSSPKKNFLISYSPSKGWLFNNKITSKSLFGAFLIQKTFPKKADICFSTASGFHYICYHACERNLQTVELIWRWKGQSA